MKIFFLWAAFLVAPGLGAQTDPASLLASIDERTNFKDGDFTATLNFVSQDPNEGPSQRKITQFRRDSQDKFLVLILAPETQKGQGTLRIDDNVWAYDPEGRKFSHSSLKESFGGTDTKNSDFRKSTWATDYQATGQTEGKLGRFDCWILDLEATNNEVSYPRAKLWVSKDIRLPLKVEGSSSSGRLLRTTYYYSWTRVGDRSYPSKILFVDALVKGKQTEVTLTDMSRETLPDEVFTKAFLERVSR